MRTEVIAGTKNVVRFPVERRARPTLELLWEIAPDVRQVLALADVFALDVPSHDLRDVADADAAEHIAAHVPASGPVRDAMLREMLDPAIASAVAAYCEAHDAAAAAAEAHQGLVEAQAADGFWLDPLRERSETLGLRMAEMMVLAHMHAETAAGVARAVGMARRGEAWAARDAEAELEALLLRRAV